MFSLIASIAVLSGSKQPHKNSRLSYVATSKIRRRPTFTSTNKTTNPLTGPEVQRADGVSFMFREIPSNQLFCQHRIPVEFLVRKQSDVTGIWLCDLVLNA